MAALIDPKLIKRLGSRLGLGRSAIYARIQNLANTFALEPRLAAVVLASQNGISISRFATREDLATIREVLASSTEARPVQPGLPPQPAVVAPSRRGSGTSRRRAQARATRTVWIVHGRNEKAATALRDFLRTLRLHPLEWSQAMSKTKKAAPYVGDVLEKAFSQAGAVVVLFTPDDEARLRKHYQKSNDPPHETRLTPQARPNVLFEAGIAFGTHPDKTVLVQLGQMRPFSDIAGRHVVHLTEDPKSRKELAEKLKTAGCDVDTSGMDWLSAGNFALSEGEDHRRHRRQPRARPSR